MKREPTDVAMPESTLLSLGLGLVLAIILGAANVYLGLYAGMTVSASIPAAVVSMAILRGWLKRGTVLENNIAQTVASTGESLAAGAIFTLPALIITGVWETFDFWISTGIVMMGGLLGIVFMVPLRKALIVDREDLRYPEGVACAEVLTVGQEGGTGIRSIILGLGLGAFVKFLVSGLHIVLENVEFAVARAERVFYGGAAMSPALLAVGYIVGLGVAVQIFLGGAIGWLFAIPVVGPWYPTEGVTGLDRAWTLWSTQIRYLGVGAMLVGGLHSIWKVRLGIVAGIQSLRGSGAGDTTKVARTERNISLTQLSILFCIAVVGTFALYVVLIQSLTLATVATLVMIPAAFFFTAVATYIVGLVGSSNSPVSGMTICAVLIAMITIWLAGGEGSGAILATLGVAGVVCCVACTAGDVAQDLKTGQLVGATPARQQWAEILGVVIPAFTMAPVLTLLHSHYGIGDKLLAPQATLFASLVEGFFGGGTLPYPMIGAGIGVGIVIILLDWLLPRTGITFRLHLMPIAVGIYLPLAISVPIVIGGAIHGWITHSRKKSDTEDHGGLLFGSGLIAGEALMGIGLAIPATLGFNLAVPLDGLPLGLQSLGSLLVFAGVMTVFVRLARGNKAGG